MILSVKRNMELLYRQNTLQFPEGIPFEFIDGDEVEEVRVVPITAS